MGKGMQRGDCEKRDAEGELWEKGCGERTVGKMKEGDCG